MTFSQGFYPDQPDLWVSQGATNGQWLTFNQTTGDLVVVPEPSTFVFAGIGASMAGWHLMKQRRTNRRSERRFAELC